MDKYNLIKITPPCSPLLICHSMEYLMKPHVKDLMKLSNENSGYVTMKALESKIYFVTTSFFTSNLIGQKRS